MEAKTIAALALVMAACGGASGVSRPTTPNALATEVAPPLAASCGRVRLPTFTATPLGSPRTGSTVALATEDGRTLAYTADEDDAALHVVDVDAKSELGETALGGRPSQLMFLPDGRLAVLLRDKSQILVLEPSADPARLDERCRIDTALEPVGLALSPDDATLLVTSGWGRALAGFDARTLAKSFEIRLAREPRAVVVSDDGKDAYVAHAVGAHATRVSLADRSVTDVDLREYDEGTVQQEKNVHAEMDRLRKAHQEPSPAFDQQLGRLEDMRHPSCQGFALAKSIEPGGRILAPQVLVDTGDPKQRTPGYGNDGNRATEADDVAVIDAATGQAIGSSLERAPDDFGWGRRRIREEPRAAECLLPRAATVVASTKSLLVACQGIDQVIAYDALAASPVRAERQRWSVAAGPNGIAVDAGKNRVVVWSQFDRALNVLELGDGVLADAKGNPPAPAPRIAMAANAERKVPADVALGRLLFHSVNDARISRDGRACASCHPDGRDDSLVWATPDGPRRSLMLAGRIVGTAPYGWNGTEDDLDVHLGFTFDRLNGAGGLRSLEREALEAYVQTLAPPPPPAPSRDAIVLRGERLFASADVGCSGCHSGKLHTDNLRHDVASKTETDVTSDFSTPTLHLVGGTGPYFHDGRYKTLHELLTSNKDTMGHTSQLSPDDIDAVEAYLRTL
jgi:mono/diheme cytochrome c family protein/DNA-binding beta-propeller fold protein YncE